jgi:hypothetical protein
MGNLWEVHMEYSHRTYQLLTYVDGVNLLGDNIETIAKNTETLIDAC